MNLFILDKNCKKSVRYHCDKHVVKLIIEAVQMLYCAFHILDEGNDSWKQKAPSNYLKVTHKNHPITKWVRESESNYRFTLDYAGELLQEYTTRYNKVHSFESHFQWLSKNKPINISKTAELTVMPLAMPDQYKTIPTKSWDDVVSSYRSYYLGEKLSFCSYKGVDWPDWIPESKRPTKITYPNKKKKAAAVKVTDETDTKPKTKTKKTTTTTTTTTSTKTTSKKTKRNVLDSDSEEDIVDTESTLLKKIKTSK